jgi:hypothetical protein
MFNWLTSLWRKPEPPNVELIANDMADDIYANRQFTPDLPELERKEWHWFFACDTTQEGHHHHHLLEGNLGQADYVGFSQDHLMMLRNDLGMFSSALIFQDQLGYKNPPKKLPIKGELYKVEPRQFLKLDEEMSNTVSCVRQLMWIVVPYSHLIANDRVFLEKAVKSVKKPRNSSVLHKDRKGKVLMDRNKKLMFRDGGPLQSNVVRQPGVWRVQAYMYISSPSYWEDFLDLNSSHPPVQSFKNEAERSIIKHYYRWTDAEYEGIKPQRE